MIRIAAFFCAIFLALSTSAIAAQKRAPPQKSEILACRLGTEDRHARIAVVLVGGKMDSFAYYSKWKPRTCSIYLQRNRDILSKWADNGNITTINLERGAFLVEHKKGEYHIVFRDVDRERYCGMDGQINGSLTIRKGSEQCELEGIMEEGTALGKAFVNMEPDPPPAPPAQAAEKPAPAPAANPDAASKTPPPEEKSEGATGATGADARGATPAPGGTRDPDQKVSAPEGAAAAGVEQRSEQTNTAEQKSVVAAQPTPASDSSATPAVVKAAEPTQQSKVPEVGTEAVGGTAHPGAESHVGATQPPAIEARPRDAEYRAD